MNTLHPLDLEAVRLIKENSHLYYKGSCPSNPKRQKTVSQAHTKKLSLLVQLRLRCITMVVLSILSEILTPPPLGPELFSVIFF